MTATLFRLDKVDKAKTYDWNAPLWLALELVDRRYPLNRSLETLSQTKPDIGPYASVIVLYEGFGVLITAAGAKRLSIVGGLDGKFPMI